MDLNGIRSISCNFGDLDQEISSLKKSKFMVLSIPYEQTTSYKAGTKEGPKAILDASRYIELYDEELDKCSYEAGIYTIGEMLIDHSGPAQMINKIYNNVKNFIDRDKILISIGGEHSITPGLVKAHKDIYPDISVLQLDAHADLRQEYEGTEFSHASAIRRVLEFCPAVQAGIRSISYEEAEFYKTTDRTRIFFAKDLKKDLKAYLNKIVDFLTDSVYITIDLDVFDPSIMPAVGTPEPGGIDWYEILDILKFVIDRKKIIGIDMVELLPQKENIASDFLAAKLIYKLIGYIDKK
ncbi:MAG: agmatinase [Candidatus Firestonebacteria bacterium]|nr:agmatinase [Candidatus Firestonebacteria bacterium]